MVNLQDADIMCIVQSLGESLLVEPIIPTEDQAPVPSDTMGSSVEVRGAFRGRVTVACSAALARVVASRMFGGTDENVTGAEVLDALHEVANVVAGNVKGLLPVPNDVGLPDDVLPPDLYQAATPEGARRLRFLLGGEPMWIAVREEPAPTAV
jgi:CheY-specific phosphatase CheX